MRQGAQRFLNSDFSTAVAELLAEKEADLTAKVGDVADATGLADAPAPRDPDARAQELKDGVQSIVDETFNDWYIRNIADADQPGRVARLSQQTDTDIQERMDGWVDYYREADDDVSDLSDREIVRNHVKNSYGLTVEEFAQLVHWRDGMHNAATNDLLVGGIQRSEDTLDQMATAAEQERDA
jgi:hypothetical protein